MQRAALWSAADGGAPSQAMRIRGRVLDRGGRPLAGAWVEVWHADANGRYRHPSQPDAVQVDAAFHGHGAVSTGPDGAWCFDSVMPGTYFDGASKRAPHVHFQVTHGDNRLVTQMFFPGQGLNDSDRWYCAVRDPARLLPRPLAARGACLVFCWDIVIGSTHAPGETP